MIGSIYSQQKCPICKKDFVDTTKDLECPIHKTSPKTYFISFYHKGRFKKYGFRSYRDCVKELMWVTNQIEHKKFDPREYKASTAKQFRFDLFIEKWLKSKENEKDKNKLSPGYYKKLVGYCNKIKPFFSTEDIRDVAKSYRIQEFYESLSSKLAPKSQKNIMDALRKILNDAHEWELISKTPKFPKIEVPDPDWTWLHEEEQDTVLRAMPPHHRPIFIFMMQYGVRPAEARALQWEDIDFKKEIITIRHNFSGGVFRKITKTKRQRQLPLLPGIAKMLRTLPKVLRCNFVFTVKGHYYGESRPDKVWAKACKAAEIRHVRLYDGTRHSIASQYANRGKSSKLIGKMLGHSNPKQTDRYSHIEVEGIRQMMKN